LKLPGLLDQLDAHDGVFVEELPGMIAIGADPADNRGQVQDQCWLRVFEQAGDGAAIPQIAVPRSGNDNVGATPCLETLDDEGAEKPCAAGDNDSLIFPEIHSVTKVRIF
jgi:hypothetical protein